MLVGLASRRSPSYRNWFRETGTDPRSIRTLDDLSRPPLLDRSHLTDNVNHFCVYPRRWMWPPHSSGTSGVPVTCYRKPGSSAFELTALERQWGRFGLRSGARRVVLRGSSFAADQDGAPTMLLPGAGQLLVSSYRLTAELPRTAAGKLKNAVVEDAGFVPEPRP